MTVQGPHCPCGSGRRLGGCCGPVVSGERLAVTAEQLMRSRYTAFATGDADHLWRTWHPRTRPPSVGLDATTTWTGLSVLATQAGGEQDDTGTVEFVARWRDASGRTGRQHEVSRFARRAGRWFYLDGAVG